MKTSLLQLVLTVWLGAIVCASPAVLDFSRSHSVEDLSRSGLVLNEIGGGGTGEKDFAFEKQDVRILLPGGRSIDQWVEQGIIDTKNDLLTQISISGGVMPQDQAFQVAQSFHRSFNLPLDDLNAWNKRNLGKQSRLDSFDSSFASDYYPMVALAIDRSVNKLYPSKVRLLIQWDRKGQRDWNEERVWRELPPPANAAISLNPPSGKRYERRDAYKGVLELDFGQF